jgi:hypothetical protein
MDYASLYQKMNADWLLKRASLTKQEIRHLANKDSFKGGRIGFMSRAYYQREKLIQNSEIFTALVFQDYAVEVEERSETFPTWLLFSPSKEINENPAILKEILAKVASIKEVEVTDKTEKKFKNYLNEPLSDVSYFEIPPAYSLGKLVYLSIVYLPLHLVPSYHLGLNLILAAPSISKEVLYFPEECWAKDYSEAYHNHVF